MKKFIIYLVLILSAQMTSAQVQTPPAKIQDIEVIKSAMFNAGKELQKSTRHYNLGLAMCAAGYTTALVSIYNNNDNTFKVTLLGAALAIGGTVLTIESRQHISKAGVHLKLQGITVY